MNKETVNIVWLKRDLRSQDHAPLLKAEREDIPYHIIYLFEPSSINYPDTSTRHLQFVYHSLLVLNKTLAPFNRRVEVFYAEAETVFENLYKQFDIRSYQESGTHHSWCRDKLNKSFPIFFFVKNLPKGQTKVQT